MKAIEILFWSLAGIIFYTYIGYGIVLYFLVKIKRLFVHKTLKSPADDELPEVTLLIPAYNEKDYVVQKVENNRLIDYPKEKLHQIWVADGSDDGTPELLRFYPEIEVLYQPERNGKIAAMNRGIKYVKSPIVVFSDANTLLGAQSIRLIAELFTDQKTGCVSGEKRISVDAKSAASSAGEGIYWKYESGLKKLDAELYSVVGAAGELFAIRTELYEEVEPDTILDDFIISLRIAMKGYTLQYNPEAFAIETASASVKEEMKRKIRIAAGGIQSVIRLYPLFNIFKYRTLSFQYISHRVLRWTLTPLALLLVFFINIFLAYNSKMYNFILILQILFYTMALVGWFLQNRKIKFKKLFVPYYFFIMNYSVFLGFFRYIRKNQSVNWERARRI